MYCLSVLELKTHKLKGGVRLNTMIVRRIITFIDIAIVFVAFGGCNLFDCVKLACNFTDHF